MKKLSVCILFGGMSPEHEVSLRSAESVLNHIDESKYNLFPVGITKEGDAGRPFPRCGARAC